MVRSLHSMTTRRSAPRGQRRIDGQQVVALLGADDVTGLVAGAVDGVSGAPADLTQEGAHEVLEVGALGRRLLALAGTRRTGRLDRRQPLVEPREAVADLGPELVERGAQAGRVQQLGEPRGVAVEVAAEHRTHPAHGGVAPGLVEQLADERSQLAAITQELLQGARQPSVAVREVLAQHGVERRRGAFAGGLCLPHETLELAPHDVHVQRDARVLECREPDAQRAFEQGRAVLLGPVRHERGEMRVHDA